MPTGTSRAYGFLLVLGGLCILGEVGAAPASLTFEKDIRPILKAHCFHCHGEGGERKGGLDVRLRRFLVAGGESGPAVVPGIPDASPLLRLVRDGEMPKGKPRLADGDLAKLERWVASGAPTARPEPDSLGPEHAFTDEERAWWSLQPVRRPDVPGPGHPVDAFVAAELREHGLEPSAEADPLVLLRRASFGLTGLPPTPEEAEVFRKAREADPGAAWAETVDRLLASPAYGERWARHWLDVAGYADSEGFNEQDAERKHAWRYRDYVIGALNEDKPFNVFVQEQLAGDEIALAEGLTPDAPTEAGRRRHESLLAATGFLRMAPDGTGTTNDLATRNACVSGTMKILGTAFYGMTVGCAECHDHRYDPVTQADYFRLRAVFEPGFDLKGWRVPTARLVSLQTAEAKAEAARIEAEAKKLDAVRLAKQAEFIEETLLKELEKREPAIRDALGTAYRTEAAKRTPEQVALLKAHPSVERLSAGSLYLYDTTYKTKHADTLKKMADEVAAVRARKPPEPFVHAFTEPARAATALPVTRVFHRGDPESPLEEVAPGDLSVLAGWRQVDVPPDDPSLPTSGRRLAYARALTDGRHPLLARVIVNRVWMHHFGRGLVASPGDFGALGEAPSHAELLDWLAATFVEEGWSLKALHRKILLSHTWRQDSAGSAAARRLDPDNRWLSHQNVRRLEAETLRDALLAVSGKLDRKAGGPPVPVMVTEEGQVVLGIDTRDTAGRHTNKFVPLDGEEYRRSIYVQIRRTRPLDLFAAFDAPSMTETNCEIRPVTTVSPQSLLLMNHAEMREHARHFAERLQREAGEDVAAQVRRAWSLAYGRPATDQETGEAVAFVQAQTEFYRQHPAKLERVVGPPETEAAPPERLGLTALCHALCSANEFLYLD
jgi:hypothetical protein